MTRKGADAALSTIKSTTQLEASDGFLHSWVFLHFEALLDDLFQRCLSFIPALNISKRLAAVEQLGSLGEMFHHLWTRSAEPTEAWALGRWEQRYPRICEKPNEIP